MVEDEVGNRSFRDQMIYIEGAGDGYLGGLTAHIAKESDLIYSRFPGGPAPTVSRLRCTGLILLQ